MLLLDEFIQQMLVQRKESRFHPFYLLFTSSKLFMARCGHLPLIQMMLNANQMQIAVKDDFIKIFAV